MLVGTSPKHVILVGCVVFTFFLQSLQTKLEFF